MKKQLNALVMGMSRFVAEEKHQIQNIKTQLLKVVDYLEELDKDVNKMDNYLDENSKEEKTPETGKTESPTQ